MDTQDHRTADGIEYFDMPGVALKFFSCAPRSAKLSVPSCAAFWLKAQKAKGDSIGQLAKCRHCPIGAAHAGREVMHFSALYDTAICPRCGFGTTRMIQKRRCISCYNREREYLTGRNAKGTVPVKMRPLDRRRVRVMVMVAGRRPSVREMVEDLTVSPLELAISALRTIPGEILFGRNLQAPGLRQLRLF